MKFAKNKYTLCSSSECMEDCIFFDEENELCHIGKTTELTQALLNQPKLLEYLKTLKKAYNRYLKNKYECANNDLREMEYYWSGMADAILAIFNDLGLGYYL